MRPEEVRLVQMSSEDRVGPFRGRAASGTLRTMLGDSHFSSTAYACRVSPEIEILEGIPGHNLVCEPLT